MFCGCGYKEALHYEEKIKGGKVGRIDERYAQVKWNGLHHVGDVITTKTDDLSRAVSVSQKTVSGISHAVAMEDIFKKGSKQRFMTIVHGMG